MAIGPRTQLEPHEILAPFGAGGMGEVYRTRDTRLNRDIAVKVLPSSFAPDQAGVPEINGIHITPDARSFAYSFRQELSQLYLVEGLR